ncbi:MAG: hypothetical protein JWN76_2395 [Chitinophagaceae bacterium]|nr:hypothetical protein [Chitinophagaceae bacterium]
MGKDRNGTYHPGKGKPSGVNKEEGLGLHPTDPDKLERYEEITERYTAGEDELAADVHMRHPNRNTSKGQGRNETNGNNSDAQNNKTRNQAFTEDRAPVQAEELPGVMNKQLFAELANHSAETCISIFIPTHSGGVEVNENQDFIRFKTALQKVTLDLSRKGVPQDKIERWLEPGYELVRTDEFWKGMSGGLAVFIADGFFKYIKMRSEPAEEVYVNSSFYVTPLLPLMMCKDYFYLLVISKKQSKLYKVDSFGIEYIDIPEIPNGVEDWVRLEEKESDALFRQGGKGGTGSASFHGHNSRLDQKQSIALYLEEVDDTIWKERLHTETVPLVLAGVDYLVPIYKSVTDYKQVWEEALTGSYEHRQLGELFAASRQLMQPYFEREKKDALERYGNKSAGALTSSIIDDVIPGTYYGQVGTLFVAKNEKLWGTFDEVKNELIIHESRNDNSEDLLDKAIIKTLLNGGEVYMLEKEQMPAESPVAALLRYP